MIVMKFGGTSLQDADRVRNAVSIVAAHRGEKPVVVLSAVGATTRRLLSLGDRVLADSPRRGSAQVSIREAHLEILADLGLDEDASERARSALDGLWNGLVAELRAVAEAHTYSPRSQDAVISVGERLSTTIFAAAATSAGVAVAPVDATSFMITDDRFRRARPDFDAIRERVEALVRPRVLQGSVVVTEGFIGATPGGQPTTMGFEASDLSAALLGAALDAHEVQIWTDVPGMLSTGHPAVRAPHVVPRLSFDEAGELALFGAKVLHPDTVAPARMRDIPVRIRSSLDPGARGTLIDGACAGSPKGIRSIAVIDDLAAVSAAGARAALRLDEHEVRGRALVCPVGEGIGNDVAVADRIDAALDGIPTRRAVGRRPHSVPLIVAVPSLEAAVRALHASLSPCRGSDDPL